MSNIQYILATSDNPAPNTNNLPNRTWYLQAKITMDDAQVPLSIEIIRHGAVLNSRTLDIDRPGGDYWNKAAEMPSDYLTGTYRFDSRKHAQIAFLTIDDIQYEVPISNSGPAFQYDDIDEWLTDV